MTLVIERRASYRHVPSNNPTNIQIMDSTGRRVTRARLLNVSTGGALICSDRIVATSQSFRIRLENAPETGWLDAEAVHFGRSNAVGIRFRSPCRSDFLMTAVLWSSSLKLATSDDETA
jgi:hypothetical protein